MTTVHQWIKTSIELIRRKDSKSGDYIFQYLNEQKNRSSLKMYIDTINDGQDISKIIEQYENLSIIFQDFSQKNLHHLQMLPLRDLISNGEDLNNILEKKKSQNKLQIQKLGDIMERLQILLKEIKTQSLIKNKKKELEKENELKKIEITFKETSILPTENEEIFDTNFPISMVKHIRKGSYISWEFYANNLFHSLREVIFIIFIK
jgi:hypothetical protein